MRPGGRARAYDLPSVRDRAGTPSGCQRASGSKENKKLAAVMKPKLCACESGLTAERCCALNLSRLSPTEAQRHLQPLEERAATARTEGALDEAERLALDVLELAPGRVPALSVLYELRKSQGRTKAA